MRDHAATLPVTPCSTCQHGTLDHPCGGTCTICPCPVFYRADRATTRPELTYARALNTLQHVRGALHSLQAGEFPEMNTASRLITITHLRAALTHARAAFLEARAACAAAKVRV